MMCWASRHVKLGLEEETSLSIRIFELIFPAEIPRIYAGGIRLNHLD